MLSEQRNKFPVTLVGFGLKNYSAMDGMDGVAYQVVMTYKGQDLCTLQNYGDGGATYITRNTAVFTEDVFKTLLDLLRNLAMKSKDIHCFAKDVVLQELYLTDYNVQDIYSGDMCIEGLFELLYELNELYDVRKSTKRDSLLAVTKGNGNTLCPMVPGSPCTCMFCETYTPIDLVKFAKSKSSKTVITTYNYILQVRANTRVLHLTMQDMVTALERAKTINTRIYKGV